MQPSTEYVVQAARARAPKELGTLKASGFYSRNIHCPAHDDAHPSCSVREDGSLYCHACNKFWGPSEAATLLGVDPPDFRNRKERRSHVAQMKTKVAKRECERIRAFILMLPKRLQPLALLIYWDSKSYGTCARSQGHSPSGMATILGHRRETINRKIRELRELGFIAKLGFYSIGFDPSLHHNGLDMRVCIESPFFSLLALDTKKEDHTILLGYEFVKGRLPRFVFLTGCTAKIRYYFDPWCRNGGGVIGGSQLPRE